MVLETYEVLHGSPIFWKNFFAPKICELCQKIGFFEFKEKFGHQFLLNLFNNKFFLLFAVPGQILY